MRAWAAVPVKGRQRAKERLRDVLGPEERGDLVAAMLADVLAALCGSRALAGVAVISPDPTMLALARAWGAQAWTEERPLDYGGAADRAARLATMRGWEALLVVPGDVPLIGPGDVDELVGLAAEQTPGIVLAPDRAGQGTNALLRRPPTCLPARFGPDSLRRHQLEARAARLSCRVWSNAAFALDVDTPDDLRLLLARGGGPATRRALARMGGRERLRGPVAAGTAR
jgi:2-phospho-L-lactate guanylyltransferase